MTVYPEHKTSVKSEEIVKSEEAGTAFRPGRLIDRTVILPTDPPPAAKSNVVQSEEEVLEVPGPTDPPPAAESDVVQSKEVSEEVKGRKTDCDDFYYYCYRFVYYNK